jgi:hypothetical protein
MSLNEGPSMDAKAAYAIGAPSGEGEQDPQRETHNEGTLVKVRVALEDFLPPQRITDAISAMQNAGILFRERLVIDAERVVMVCPLDGEAECSYECEHPGLAHPETRLITLQEFD